LFAHDILRFAKQREDWLAGSTENKEGDKLDPIHEHGVKRKNALFALPYWKVHTANFCFTISSNACLLEVNEHDC
jgi:hypothetical protein